MRTIFLFLLFLTSAFTNTYAQVVMAISPERVLLDEGIKIEYFNAERTYALATKEGKHGIIDTDYKVVIPFEYDAFIRIFQKYENVAAVRKGSQFYLIDKENKRVGKVYDYLYGPYNNHLFIAKKSQQYFLIESTGKELTEDYDREPEFAGLYYKNYFVVSKNKKFGLIEADPKFVTPITHEVKQLIPMEYDDLKAEVRDGQMIAQKNKYGVINLRNKVIIPFAYDKIGFSNAEGSFSKEYNIWLNGKQGIISRENIMIVKPEYDNIFQQEEGFRKAQKGDFYGLLDVQGKVVIPFEYRGLYKFDAKPRLRVSKDGLWGIIGLDNRLIIPMKYYKISKHSFSKVNPYSKNGFIYKVSLDGKKYFIIDEKDRVIHDL